MASIGKKKGGEEAHKGTPGEQKRGARIKAVLSKVSEKKAEVNYRRWSLKRYTPPGNSK